MIPRTLFIISSDPRSSPRPAEAIRIAAGVGTWQKNTITVYLRGLAVLVLGENVDELMDGENFVRYLPMVPGFGHPIYVERNTPWLTEAGPTELAYQEVSDIELATLAAQANYVVSF